MASRGGVFDYREAANSPLSRLQPAVKVVYFVTVAALAFIYQHPAALLVLFVAQIAVAVMARISRSAAKLFAALVGSGALITVLTWLPFGETGTTLVTVPLVFGLTLRITDVGVLWGCAMALRIVNMSLPLFLLLSTTKPRDLTIGLSTLGMPFVAGTMFVMTLRLVPMVQNDAAVIREAQRARALDLEAGGLWERVRKQISILAPLIFTSLRRIQLVANSLDAKGFRSSVGQHRFYRAPRLRAIDVAIMVVLVAVLALSIYVARFLGWGIIIPGRL